MQNNTEVITWGDLVPGQVVRRPGEEDASEVTEERGGYRFGVKLPERTTVIFPAGPGDLGLYEKVSEPLSVSI